MAVGRGCAFVEGVRAVVPCGEPVMGYGHAVVMLLCLWCLVLGLFDNGHPFTKHAGTWLNVTATRQRLHKTDATAYGLNR